MAGVDILASAMSGANAAFLSDLYARWVEKPDSVDPSFDELFAALNDDARAVLTDASGASWAPRPRGGFAPAPERRRRRPARARRRRPVEAVAAGRAGLRGDPPGHARFAPRADADPLLPGARAPAGAVGPARPAADQAARGAGPGDLRLHRGRLGPPDLHQRRARAGNGDARARSWRWCRATYCGPIGVEFMHIQAPDQKAWIQQRMEGAPWVGRLRRQGQARHPGAVDRGGGLRGVLREASTSPPSASGWRAARAPSRRCRR